MADNDQWSISWFPDSILKEIALPEKFTFPFFYEPHPLTKIAATELQQYLETQTELDLNFGLKPDSPDAAIGKMFGVLLVQDQDGRVGYLSAFSGPLSGTDSYSKFVPPVFNMLAEEGFYLEESENIDAVSRELNSVESDPCYLRLKSDAELISRQSLAEISALKEELKANKKLRKRAREEQKNCVTEQEFVLFDAELIKHSLHDGRRLKTLTEKWKQQSTGAAATLAPYDNRIEALKKERRERSAALQEQLFSNYVFLNRRGKGKNLLEIFKETAFGKPPAAAGDCATPKLLQAAFLAGYRPLAMAEFWWGASPKSEIRKHKQFYPACTGRCKPILEHMLEGIPVDENPFLAAPAEDRALRIEYEDEHLLVVNKPSGLRSVPGVDVFDSVYSRVKYLLADVEPQIVHRLDMDTSGLLVIAKTPEVHRHLQRQFLRRTVSKRYTALLSKKLAEEEGIINLPLSADPFNRPRQLVCFESGKESITRWKVIERSGSLTRIHFWPHTGRTHQLRMHAAHELGLNAPIVGDDLYGTSAGRLFLHAAELAFVHPISKATMRFEAAEEF